MKTHLLEIKGRIPSKKNSRVSAGRFTVASPKYREWEESSAIQIIEFKDKLFEKVDIQLDFYLPDNRATDLDNKVTSIFDLLKHIGVIKDDSWQCLPSFQAKAMGIDKENPRVEIWIKEITDA